MKLLLDRYARPAAPDAERKVSAREEPVKIGLPSCAGSGFGEYWTTGSVLKPNEGQAGRDRVARGHGGAFHLLHPAPGPGLAGPGEPQPRVSDPSPPALYDRPLLCPDHLRADPGLFPSLDEEEPHLHLGRRVGLPRGRRHALCRDLCS